MQYSSVIMLGLSMLFLGGCTSPVFQAAPSEKVQIYQENHEITGEEKEEMLTDLNISETIFDISDRDNSDPELEEGYYFDVANEEEFSLPTGRYWFSGEISGNIYIYDEKDDLLIHEIIGHPGVSGFYADVDASHTIKIDGLEYAAAHLNLELERSNELNTGIWHVGTDIQPGNYTLNPIVGFGHVIIMDPNGEAQIFELIGSQAVSTESEINLRDGQVVRVTGISTVELESRE